MAAEHLLAQIAAQSGTETQLDALRDSLRGQREQLIMVGGATLTAVVGSGRLSAEHHSLGIAFLLSVAAETLAEATVPDFVRITRGFLRACTDQVCRTPYEFADLCRGFARWSCRIGQAREAIRALEHAVHVTRPHMAVLVPAQAELLQCAIASKCYFAGLRALEAPVYEIEPRKTGLTPVEFQRFWYYAGLVYTAVKRYDDAKAAYLLCLCAPASALSAMAVESYKRLLLVHLIASGGAGGRLRLPKTAPPAVARQVGKCAPVYEDMAGLFEDGSSAAVEAFVGEHAERLMADKTLGLAKLALAAHRRRQIARLTNTYITLSVDAIAESAGAESPAAAERSIERMTESGEIFCKISHATGMATFEEDPEDFAGPGMQAQLDAMIRDTVAVHDKLRALDEKVTASAAYIRRSVVSEAMGGGGAGGLSGWDADSDLQAAMMESMR